LKIHAKAYRFPIPHMDHFLNS